MKRLSLLLIAMVANVCCVMALAPSISIDGDFSDWERVPWEYLAEDTVDGFASAGLDNLYRVRLCSDADNIYFYVEFNNDVMRDATGAPSETDTNINYVVRTTDLFIDTDNSAETGYQIYLWDDCGADYLIEGLPREDSGELFRFSQDAPKDDWSGWETMQFSEGLRASRIVVLENGHAALEGYVSRAVLSIQDGTESIRVGAMTQSSNWTETGVLPESRADKEGTVVRSNPLTVPLYNCEAMTWQLSNMITAELYCNGIMVIQGEGEMVDFEQSGATPWANYTGDIMAVHVEEGVTSVGKYAFAMMTQMVTASLPSTITTIGDYSFMGTTSLQSLVCFATTPPTIGKSTFSRTNSNIIVYVPMESIEDYKSDKTWSQYFQGTFMSIEPVVVIGGDTIEVDPTTGGVVDINHDGTLMYDTEENTLTLTGLEVEGEIEGTAIEYSGSEPLTIVLNDESSITADVVIASASDVIITGEGSLVAEGVVPIVGTENANITFIGVNMVVRSVAPSESAIRRLRKTRFAKRLDETGGPALSGFGSADFEKVEVSPSETSYGSVQTGEGSTINALYYTSGDNAGEVVTEFTLTAIEDAVEDVRTQHSLDTSKPMYNVLGVQVSADYKGIVIQEGQKFMK